MAAIDCRLVNKATDQANTTITTVRMAVARLESTPCTPIFARIAVIPANNAESNAQISQFIFWTPDTLLQSYILCNVILPPMGLGYLDSPLSALSMTTPIRTRAGGSLATIIDVKQ